MEDVDESQLACFRVWTDWCRANGYLTRNEAHGAPSNWLDFYALADIPETEMFGKADRDVLLSKFASSAAHVKGTRLVSAESCTWIDEHFCDANVLSPNYRPLDASKWPVRPSGLLGPVVLRAEAADSWYPTSRCR